MESKELPLVLKVFTNDGPPLGASAVVAHGTVVARMLQPQTYITCKG